MFRLDEFVRSRSETGWLTLQPSKISLDKCPAVLPRVTVCELVISLLKVFHSATQSLARFHCCQRKHVRASHCGLAWC